MIISFNGDEGSGKSTISKKIAQEIGFKYYYMGQVFRDIAKEKGMTLAELHELCVKDSEVDKQVDQYLVTIAEREDNFVVESRTAWYFLPQSLKIYLTVDEREGAKRVFNELQQENQRNEDSKIHTFQDALESIRGRKKKDDARYESFYGINIREKSNYDFVLDTTNLSIEQVFSRVLAFVKEKLNS